MTVSEGAFGLVDTNYEAGLDPDRWRYVIGALCRKTGALGGALHVRLGTDGFSFGVSVGVDPAALTTYEQHYHAINPLNAPLARHPTGVAVPAEALVPTREMVRTEYYADYAERFGIRSSATVVLAKASGHLAALGVVGARLEQFDVEKLALLDTLAPHLVRATEMNRRLDRLAAERDGRRALVDRLDTAVLVVDGSGTVHDANPVAEALIEAHDGVSVKDRSR
jgi:hypothetical protein